MIIIKLLGSRYGGLHHAKKANNVELRRATEIRMIIGSVFNSVKGVRSEIDRMNFNYC